MHLTSSTQLMHLTCRTGWPRCPKLLHAVTQPTELRKLWPFAPHPAACRVGTTKATVLTQQPSPYLQVVICWSRVYTRLDSGWKV